MSSTADPTHTHIPLHIQIGVTGHRDLTLTKQLEASIDTALTDKITSLLHQQEKRNTPLRFSILSPLAEGADRFVAKQAMQSLNAELEVVLPMNEDEYMEDFTSQESCNEFENMLKQAASCQQLIRKPLPEVYPGRVRKEQRQLAYEKVGHFVVDHCDILIAIWDGQPADSNAGTGAIVEYARSEVKPLIIIDAGNYSNITTEEGNGHIVTMLDKTELFNTFTIDTVEMASKIKIESGYIFPDEKEQLIHRENINYAKEHVMPWYVKADTIAMRSQKKYQRVGLLIYVLSPFAVALVALGILIPIVSWLFYSLEFLILLFAYIKIKMADRAKIHKKWIESRYLAEHLRCAIYFAACGLKPPMIKNVVQMRIHHQANSWAAEVYNNILNNLPDIPAYKLTETGICIEYIRKYWINEQYKFHSRKAVRTGKKGKQLEITGQVVFFMALAFALAHVSLGIFHQEDKLHAATDIAVFIAISFPVLGASLGAIKIHREYSRLEKQSAEMARVLKELQVECDDISTHHEFEKFMVKTQEVMLHDIQSWHSLMELIKLESV